MSALHRFACLAAVVASSACLPPEWGANAILHPWRRPRVLSPSVPYRPLVVSADGATLQGWVMPGVAPVRGTLVYTHGVADNRQSAIGFAQRYVARGFDVIAYDSRALLAALSGPKRLLLVPRAGHNDALAREETWQQIDAFIDSVAAPAP